jgi:hypothetical protein
MFLEEPEQVTPWLEPIMRSPPTPRRRRTPAAACAVLLVVLLVGVADQPLHAQSVDARRVAPVLADPSGEAMPIGDLDGWRQVFTDDFTTDVPLGEFPDAVADKWSAYPSPVKDTIHHGTYSPGSVVSVADGVLNQYIHAEGRVFMVSALLPKVPGTEEQGQMYGRYAVRFKADPIEGYKMAWLLWPDSGRWPRDGEIDFPERNLVSDNVNGFVHHQGARHGSDQTSTKVAYDPSTWHTAVIEWSPDLVVFTLDGVEIRRVTERVPHTPMHWVLQTETMLTSKRPPKAAAGNVQIDWVAAWQYDPTAVAPPPVTAAPAPSTTSSPPPTRPTGVRYRVIRI